MFIVKWVVKIRFVKGKLPPSSSLVFSPHLKLSDVRLSVSLPPKVHFGGLSGAPLPLALRSSVGGAAGDDAVRLRL